MQQNRQTLSYHKAIRMSLVCNPSIYQMPIRKTSVIPRLAASLSNPKPHTLNHNTFFLFSFNPRKPLPCCCLAPFRARENQKAAPHPLASNMPSISIRLSCLISPSEPTP